MIHTASAKGVNLGREDDEDEEADKDEGLEA